MVCVEDLICISIPTNILLTREARIGNLYTRPIFKIGRVLLCSDFKFIALLL